MNIVWFSWKDKQHPEAGGAEVLSWNILENLVKDGHKVKLLTSSYKGAAERQEVNNVEIIRFGNKYTVYGKARNLFKKELEGWPDLVVDEMNTIPFACAFYSQTRSILLTYQLAREVWFFQMIFPFSFIGYIMEPLYLRILSKKYNTVITESESTRKDLARYGFDKKNISVFRSGIDMRPLKSVGEKSDLHHILILGSIRPMKQTLQAIKGFEFARDTNPKLHLTVAGNTDGAYASKVIGYSQKSRHSDAIKVVGRVSASRRKELMQESAVILVTSKKEGWGLIITEANSQGTPAIAFDADGLRDSIKNNKTGMLVKQGDNHALGLAINRLLNDVPSYLTMRENAWQDSKQYTFDASYEDFLKCSGINHSS